MKLKFSDGVTIETSGPLRKLHLEDGWYVVGDGFCIPVASERESDKTIVEMTESKRSDGQEPKGDIDIIPTREHLIFVLCCAQHNTNNVVVSVMLSSINGRPSSFTHDHHKAVRVNQIGSVPPGCYSGVGCPHHNIFFCKANLSMKQAALEKCAPLTRAQPAAWKKDPDIMAFLSSLQPHTGTASPLQDHGQAGG